ncbi:MAG: hypothetical protein KJ879_01230 [Nanoarchaeota archaeon]|nr:hypothetical protein [Nanoarchaeota archaeon]
MRKGVIVLLLLGVFLFSPLVLAQEQAQTYSGLNRFTDNVKLAFSGGDNKVRLALEIREKEVDSAINNIQNQEEDEAIKNLERATKKLQTVQEKVSLNTSEEIKTSVKEITDKINTNKALSEVFEDYLLEEQKTQLTAELTEKTYEYCKELAKEDFVLMLQEEVCDPETAVEGLEEKLKELKNLQEELFTELMWNIRSCIDDPGTCNCEEVADVEDKPKCEKMVALAIKCEYKEDETSCDELKAMEPKAEDGFAESFVPDFLMDLFKKKQSMVDYDIEKSDGVPPECWNWNEKPECRQYDHLKEWHYRGENNEERPGKPKEKEPTMQESVPECFDDEGTFLEEKCGEIIIVKNKDGLINYIVKNNVDGIIEKFENKSAQHIIPDTIDEGEWTVSDKAREIKRDMNQITNQIKDITYAPGTGPGGSGGNVVDGDGQNVASDGDGGDTVIDGGDDGNVIDSGTVDNDVAGVDSGPDGIVGTVVDPDAIDD